MMKRASEPPVPSRVVPPLAFEPPVEPVLAALRTGVDMPPTRNDCGCGSVCRIGLARPLAQRIYVTVEA